MPDWTPIAMKTERQHLAGTRPAGSQRSIFRREYFILFCLPAGPLLYYPPLIENLKRRLGVVNRTGRRRERGSLAESLCGPAGGLN